MRLPRSRLQIANGECSAGRTAGKEKRAVLGKIFGIFGGNKKPADSSQHRNRRRGARCADEETTMP